MDQLRALPVAVAAMVLCCELWAVQPAQGFSPQGVMKVRVLNGRCILRGKSIDEAYFTLKNGTCVRAACHAKDKLVRFTPLQDCPLAPTSPSCYYEDGVMATECCQMRTICAR
ncbi:unnamed protein product [Ixodes persulcatus]